MRVAALYVERGGAYWDLDGVDPWDEARDARLYAGPHPVVAHPPCSRWCRLAGLIEARWGHKRGDDGGCFASAIHAVRTWGGVLEHPAFSDAWAAFGLQRPMLGRWRGAPLVGWVTEVCQRAYGHRARKRTWLYAFGFDVSPPALDWSQPEPIATVGKCRNHGGGDLPRLHQKEAKSTPPAFRDALLSIARSASLRPVADRQEVGQ